MMKETKYRKIITDLLLEELGEGRKHRTPSYDKVSLVDDPKVRQGKEWVKHGGNFPIMRNGNVYYVSRSMTVTCYVYCKNANGEWCVLANKRGRGAQNAQGLWNVTCGYLDYGETAEEAAVRETWEETGVKIPSSALEMMGMNSKPGGRRQDVSVRFAGVLNGTIDDYPTDISHCEPGEVEAAMWVPLSKVNKLNWAYGQGNKVIGQAKTSLGDFENGDVNDISSMVARLYSEINGNPTAKHLLNNILNNLGYKRW